MKSYIIFCLLTTFCVCYSQKQRISGGSDAVERFVVSIQYARKHICAGSILQDTSGAATRYVVTAAHCIAGLDEELLTVQYGNPKLQVTNRAYVEEGFVHSGYQKGNYMYDIGVLRIIGDFTVPGTALTGIVPSRNEDEEGPNAYGEILGWGAQSGTNNVIGISLKKSRVIYVPYEQCLAIYPNLASHMFCTNQAQSAACYGDDGGPFIKEINGTVGLVGIISWGSSCISPRPKVLIRVIDFQTWLEPFTVPLPPTVLPPPPLTPTALPPPPPTPTALPPPPPTPTALPSAPPTPTTPALN